MISANYGNLCYTWGAFDCKHGIRVEKKNFRQLVSRENISMANHFSMFDFLVHFPNFNDVSKFLCLIILCFTLKWTFGSRDLSRVTPSRIQKRFFFLFGLGG